MRIAHCSDFLTEHCLRTALNSNDTRAAHFQNAKRLHQFYEGVNFGRAPRHLNEITECLLAVQNQTYNCSMITFRPARTVKIFTDPQMNWTLDGEKAEGHSEILMENLHHAVRIVKRVD